MGDIGDAYGGHSVMMIKKLLSIAMTDVWLELTVGSCTPTAWRVGSSDAIASPLSAYVGTHSIPWLLL
eukprot:5855881-Amphidinium_carterae.3